MSATELSSKCGDDNCRDADGNRDEGTTDTLDGKVGGSEATEEADVCRCKGNAEDACSINGLGELHVLLRLLCCSLTSLRLPTLHSLLELLRELYVLRLDFEVVESARRTLRHTDGE